MIQVQLKRPDLLNQTKKTDHNEMPLAGISFFYISNKQAQQLKILKIGRNPELKVDSFITPGLRRKPDIQHFH